MPILIDQNIKNNSMNCVNKLLAAFTLIVNLLIFSGCEKFLAEKTSKKLVVPQQLEDFQALLDNVSFTNLTGVSAGAVSSDDYYLPDVKFDALTSENDRRMYTWEKDYVFSTDGFNNWSDTYNSVYYSNTVILGIEGIVRTPANAKEWDNVKGQALFCRGYSFLDAATIWCLAYDEKTAVKDLGLPLRLNTNFNESSKRSTVQKTYEQIISDLKGAVALLPSNALSKFRANKAAAYGLLARTYLFMRKYREANLYADSSLMQQKELLDYNNLTLGAAYPIDMSVNPEFLYARYLKTTPVLSTTNPVTLPELYNSFEDDDLRKRAFFAKNSDGSFYFKGSYFGRSSLFSGIATDEVLLIKAECMAIENDPHGCIALINQLRLKRWDKNKVYSPYSTSDPVEARKLVIIERRKELMMRGLRWMDVKRLNKEGYNISLSRAVHGKTYTLGANDLRFALPIPEDVIALSGMEQNKR